MKRRRKPKEIGNSLNLIGVLNVPFEVELVELSLRFKFHELEFGRAFTLVPSPPATY